jgi:hypothetical protein
MQEFFNDNPDRHAMFLPNYGRESGNLVKNVQVSEANHRLFHAIS